MFFRLGQFFQGSLLCLTKNVWRQLAISYKNTKLNFRREHENMNNAISFDLAELTRPYDNREIIRITLRILFKTGKREKNKNYICSELVRDAFVKAGFGFKIHDTFISPQKIWKDRRIELNYRIL